MATVGMLVARSCELQQVHGSVNCCSYRSAIGTITIIMHRQKSFTPPPVLRAKQQIEKIFFIG
jgi:hypothetical protein